MGGLGPGIGGFELVVIGLVALLVVGPKDLPVLMRRIGQMVAKARGMANEFRSSFDEMARQSELDDLRKEVEALRTGQGAMYPLGAEAEAAFKEINTGLIAPPSTAEAASSTIAAEEWPDASSAAPSTEPEPVAAAAPSKPKRAPKAPKSPTATKTKTKASATPSAAKSRTPRKKAAES